MLSLVSLLREYDFHGLDLDWEYPAKHGSPPDDKERFTTLCEEMLAAFDEESEQTGQPRLMLTAAVAAGKSTIDSAYEVDKLADILDFVNLMAYDLHGYWDYETGHHTALVDPSGSSLTVTSAVEYWINLVQFRSFYFMSTP